MMMLKKCVTSSVLSCHSKDLQLWTSVTAPLQLSFIRTNHDEHTLEAWGRGDPKGEASILLGFLLKYICLSPLSLPYANWASQEGGVFALTEVLTQVYGFPFVLFSQAFHFVF